MAWVWQIILQFKNKTKQNKNTLQAMCMQWAQMFSEFFLVEWGALVAVLGGLKQLSYHAKCQLGNTKFLLQNASVVSAREWTIHESTHKRHTGKVFGWFLHEAKHSLSSAERFLKNVHRTVHLKLWLKISPVFYAVSKTRSKLKEIFILERLDFTKNY